MHSPQRAAAGVSRNRRWYATIGSGPTREPNYERHFDDAVTVVVPGDTIVPPGQLAAAVVGKPPIAGFTPAFESQQSPPDVTNPAGAVVIVQKPALAVLPAPIVIPVGVGEEQRANTGNALAIGRARLRIVRLARTVGASLLSERALRAAHAAIRVVGRQRHAAPAATTLAGGATNAAGAVGARALTVDPAADAVAGGGAAGRVGEADGAARGAGAVRTAAAGLAGSAARNARRRGRRGADEVGGAARSDAGARAAGVSGAAAGGDAGRGDREHRGAAGDRDRDGRGAERRCSTA